ncbi:14042_t:CDS:2 [Funneliformis mosseae]|uniref:14042_t:CDS:1 n=1 Tax=Funneliformis mosseae TaxID=27381 RepID=A0A9N8Z4J6_FUNMO|nr:14042_t:CDS:2 [Funneliformis mosseae]
MHIEQPPGKSNKWHPSHLYHTLTSHNISEKYVSETFENGLKNNEEEYKAGDIRKQWKNHADAWKNPELSIE